MLSRLLSRLRTSRLLRVLLALVALAFAGYGLHRNWDGTVSALARLSWWSPAGAFTAVMTGAGLMMVAWQRVVAGLGSPFPLGVAARVLFVGQLGKYVPGSVWAYAAMMELGRDHGCPPRRTFSGTSIALVVSLGCAVALAAATLPFTARSVAEQAWYLALVIPVIVVCLHPRVLTWGLNLVLRLARRDLLDEVLPGRALLGAVAWTVCGWLVYGLHAWLVIGDLTGDFSPSAYLLGAGAYAFAWASGLLAAFVPAGVGVREGAMVLVLAPSVGTGNAVVVAVLSRLAFTFTDVAWAGIGFLLGRRAAQPPVPEAAETSASTYAAQ
ncbi:membrane protein [Planomonospora parontospora subsp. parontospora]|uniref:Membrane protein n=2 Tax=Planomonospora parontospora TaxID=58119 RepID=A0AA37F3K1_9ACTN|nr:lysylphosphatidylglycerol synthase domain-containing protein [Planomonospora parontospora]GGK58623.1 membrane protein [Planomonospora parontospora]GII07925.1 membrane protein [Planomonospora parontospora subsp. parontospora]